MLVLNENAGNPLLRARLRFADLVCPKSRWCRFYTALSVEVFGGGLDKMTHEEGARLGLMKSKEVLHKAGIAA